MILFFLIHRTKKDANSSYNDHEEEFYYTEIETTVDSMSDMFADMNTSSPPPTLSHMDMVRPPHEDPDMQRDSNGNNRACQERVEGHAAPMLQNNVTMVRSFWIPWYSCHLLHPQSLPLDQINNYYFLLCSCKISIP